MLVRSAVEAMATRFEVVVEAGDEVAGRAAAEAALAEISDCEARLSLFRTDSLLAHLNRTARRRPVRVDEDTFGLLRLCVVVHRRSRGAFDPTIAPWMRELGLQRRPDDGARGVGMAGVVLDAAERTVRFARRDLALDLGGVAKGHALDLAARELRRAGVERALVHGGTSSVVALGAPPGREAWRVRIGAEPENPIAVLTDAALSVSRAAGRTAEKDGKRFGHVLDPRSGRPVPLGACAAVVHRRAAAADAWSTAVVAALPFMPERAASWSVVWQAAAGRPWQVRHGRMARGRFEFEVQAPFRIHS